MVLESCKIPFLRRILKSSLNIDVGTAGVLNWDENHVIYLKQAPEPNDVDWDNIEKWINLKPSH